MLTCASHFLTVEGVNMLHMFKPGVNMFTGGSERDDINNQVIGAGGGSSEQTRREQM